MFRRSTPCLALLTVLLCAACDQPGSDGKTQTAEAGSAPGDFAKARDDYRDQKQKDLALLDKTSADLDVKEKIVAAKGRADLDAALTTLKAQRSAFVTDLGAIDGVAASDWASTERRLEKEWADLKATSDKATSEAASAAVAVFKPGEMSCQDFVALADVEKPKIIYWAEGFNKNGKPADTAVDVAETDRMIPVIVSDCMKAPKQALSTAVQAHPVARAPSGPAPKPQTMTCQEFVALGDSTQPRLVYWAEGFDKDGGPADSVVDIEQTDSVVPIVVKECTEEPKLTFWQKLKKHF